MTEKEVREYCSSLFEQVQEKDKQMSCVLSTLDEIKEDLRQARSENKTSSAQLLQEISQLRNQLKNQATNESLERLNKNTIRPPGSSKQGTYFDYDSLPGTIAYNWDSLCDCLENGNYMNECDNEINRFFKYRDGSSSKRIIEYIITNLL